MDTTTTRTNDHSLAALVRELRDETTLLVRQEVALAKAEVSEKSSRLAKNAIYIAAGALVAYAALVVLLLALRDLFAVALVEWGVSDQVAVWLSPLIIGIIIGLMGWGLIAKGKKAIQRTGFSPDKTIETLQEDKEWAKHRFQKTT